MSNSSIESWRVVTSDDSVISLFLNYAKRECRQYPPGIETLVQRITHLLWNIILWVQLPSSAPHWFLSIINFITKKIFWYIWKILSIWYDSLRLSFLQRKLFMYFLMVRKLSRVSHLISACPRQFPEDGKEVAEGGGSSECLATLRSTSP